MTNIDQIQASIDLSSAAFRFARETQKNFGSSHPYTIKALDNAIEAMKQSNELIELFTKPSNEQIF